ncbi:hypothetical protein BGZ98_005901 [Dissophora globulifera]|nr:hypothetical protein BGZ98_005901 [Dissophora globulifera]
MSSAEQFVRTEYPVIDSDPHFTRVVSYMRAADVAAWGGLTAAAPALLLGLVYTVLDEKSRIRMKMQRGGSWTKFGSDDEFNWISLRPHRIRPAAGPKGINVALSVATGLGFMGGFLYSYQKSSLRFWGWEENSREQAKNQIEMDARAAAGLPAYGEPTMDEASQAAAARNSKYSALKFSAIPWFNTTNHKYHLSENTASKSAN